MHTLNGNVSFVVSGETRLLLRKLSSATGGVASRGMCKTSECVTILALIGALSSELGEPDGEENDEDPISPTPESEAGCAEFQHMWDFDND